MQLDPAKVIGFRPLTDHERALALWMLEHGGPEAAAFLPQLERAEATDRRCPCGCPTVDFKIAGLPQAPAGVHILAYFMYGPEEDPNGIFIFEQAGILSSMEVFSYSGDHPTRLPEIVELRPVGSSTAA